MTVCKILHLLSSTSRSLGKFRNDESPESQRTPINSITIGLSFFQMKFASIIKITTMFVIMNVFGCVLKINNFIRNILAVL